MGEPFTSVNSYVTSYKVRVIVKRNPDPSPILNSYDIISYIYADNNPDNPVAIPSPITVNGRVTWNGGLSYYPIETTIPTSGISMLTQEVAKPDELTADNFEYVSLSTYNLGGIPVSFDQIVFE